MSTLNARIESAILHTLILNLSQAGFKPVAVWTDEDYAMFDADGKMQNVAAGHRMARSRTPVILTADQVAEIFSAIDMYAPTVHFTDPHKTTWGNHGVMCIPGNGVDFISDYHSGDAAFESILNTVSEAASEGAFSLSTDK